MTEPGSCDAFTSAEPDLFGGIAQTPPTPPTPSDRDRLYYSNLSYSEETTPSGWTIRHTRVGHRGPEQYRTDITHPWLGTLGRFYWGHR